MGQLHLGSLVSNSMKNEETNQDNIGADSEIPKGRDRSEERSLAEAPHRAGGRIGKTGEATSSKVP